MAKTAALSSLAASYEERFGRASRSALGELARRYAAAAQAVSSGAAAESAAPIVAHLLGRIAALKRDVLAALQPADCAEADASPSERGDRPLADSIRQSARKDMLAMSGEALQSHLEDLERIRDEPPGAVAGSVLPGHWRREFEAEYRALMIEVEAALHIGWFLQEEFSDASAHAATESLLLARMTPYEREQYEVRKENARRRQELRRNKPEIFSLDAARRARLVSRTTQRSN